MDIRVYVHLVGQAQTVTLILMTVTLTPAYMGLAQYVRPMTVNMF